MTKNNLFGQPLSVINVGLESFQDSVKSANAKVTQVEWKPSVEVDSSVFEKIRANLSRINEANAVALDNLQKGSAFLTGMGVALDVIPGMKKNLFLHAGPPVTWDRMCGPMKGAMIGATIYEGLASNADEVEKMALNGEIEFSPCHEHSSVGPMAGVVSASMPVFIIENEAFGNKAFCTQNEGLGKVLRYGAFAPEVIEKLKWMEKVLYPTLKRAIESAGKIDIKNLIAQALHMGDEAHNRNRAGTSLFLREIVPHLVKTSQDAEITSKVVEFMTGNDHFFLNLTMPAGKAMLDAARDVPNSSMLVVMARNGTDFGIQLSGTGSEWFVGPALVPDALFFPGYTKADANPDIGDSAITETYGVGGFAIAAAPAIVQFVGGSAADSINYTLSMYEITVGENEIFQIPALDFRGTPTGIDVIKVVEKGLTPFIDTGVAHKNPGVGQVGAGLVSAPTEPFRKAIEKFVKTL